MPPAADARFDLLETAVRQRGAAQHALIEILHVAQKLFGQLDPGLLRFVARQLRLPPSRVYGVATFYHMFSLRPRGRHVCIVCEGTACHVRGGPAVMAAARAATGIGPGETTPDGAVTLLNARCIGSCGLSPLAVCDGEVMGPLSAEETQTRLGRWMAHDPR
jgi:bidirectional [NiFe] hydrogenase diaphorase subunit